MGIGRLLEYDEPRLRRVRDALVPSGPHASQRKRLHIGFLRMRRAFDDPEETLVPSAGDAVRIVDVPEFRHFRYPRNKRPPAARGAGARGAYVQRGQRVYGTFVKRPEIVFYIEERLEDVRTGPVFQLKFIYPSAVRPRI